MKIIKKCKKTRLQQQILRNEVTNNTNNTYNTTHIVQQAVAAAVPLDAAMPPAQPPPGPPPAASPTLFRDTYHQTDTIPAKLTVTRATSYPPESNFPSSSNGQPPPDPPAQSKASSSPLGSSADAYHMQNFTAAQAQQSKDQRELFPRQEELLRRHSEHLGPQAAYVTNNNILQQGFVAHLLENRQFSTTTNQTLINPMMSSSSNQGPPPDAPAGGAVISKAQRRTPQTFTLDDRVTSRLRSGNFEDSTIERPKRRSESKVRGGPTRATSRAPPIEVTNTKKRERIGEEEVKKKK